VFWKSERALYLNKEINWLCRKDPYARVLIVVCTTKVPFYYWLLRNISQEIDRSRQCMHSTLTYLAYDYFWQFRLYACEKLTKWLETRRRTVLANNAAPITIVTGYAFRILVCLFSLLFHSKQPIVHVIRLYSKDGSNVDLCRRKAIENGKHLVIPGSDGAELIDELKPLASY